MWHATGQAGWAVGHDHVARLGLLADLADVVRGRKPSPTIPVQMPHLVNWNFNVSATNHLWMANITYVHPTSGICYTTFVTDAGNRKIAGWSTRTTRRIEALPLKALDHALLRVKDQSLEG